MLCNLPPPRLMRERYELLSVKVAKELACYSFGYQERRLDCLSHLPPRSEKRTCCTHIYMLVHRQWVCLVYSLHTHTHTDVAVCVRRRAGRGEGRVKFTHALSMTDRQDNGDGRARAFSFTVGK